MGLGTLLFDHTNVLLSAKTSYQLPKKKKKKRKERSSLKVTGFLETKET